MSKILKLKDWFTLEDAARRLSGGLQEPVSTQDILQLTLEGHLPLCWYARNILAQPVSRFVMIFDMLGDVLPHIAGEARSRTPREYETSVYWHGIYGYRTPKGFQKGDVMSPYALLTWRRVHEESDRCSTLHGIYQLEIADCPALGDWIQDFLMGEGENPHVMEELIVSDEEGNYYQVMQCLGADPDTKKPIYCPTDELPSPAELVIRRRDIEVLEARLSSTDADVQSGTSPTEKSISTRERTTLLTIIAALAAEAKINIDQPSKAGALIESLTEQLGARVAARTIEGHLKKVPDALERRANTTS